MSQTNCLTVKKCLIDSGALFFDSIENNVCMCAYILNQKFHLLMLLKIQKLFRKQWKYIYNRTISYDIVILMWKM